MIPEFEWSGEEDVRYSDESKDILKAKLNEDVSADSDGGVDQLNFADNKGVLK